ncbi:MAG: hypothetical protein R6X12_03915 [bacterium]
MRTTAVLLGLVGIAFASASASMPVSGQAEPDWYYLHPDSLLVPTGRAERFGLPAGKLFYLEHRHGLCPSQRRQDEPEALNVRMVGKWGGGPSWGVTGQDSLVYLSRGSEVVVVNFADPASPAILSHIQARRLAGRPVLQDSLLYLATSGYIEVFNIKDPVHAFRVGRLGTAVNDIAVADTLVYVIARDSFKVYSFADPQAPYLVGACRDSGYALDVERGYAYLRDRWGMYILDATDPANPRRVASWGTDIAGVKVRGNYCYVAQGQMGSNSLHVLNVSNPASPWEEGRLSGLTAEDIHLLDTLLFMPGFYVVSIADPSRPRLLGQAPAGGYEAWVDDAVRYGVTANWAHGLRVLDLADLANPVLDTTMLAAYAAADISVKDGIACVASQRDYMMLFDISNPAEPREVGRYTSRGVVEAVLNAGTFAYVPAAPAGDTVLHAVDITDPANPLRVGWTGGWEGPRAMALQDSFLYCAEPYRFEVFNVADPRQPVWMGRCGLTTWRGGMAVQDTFAYIAPNIEIINIARPDQPTPVSSTTLSAWDIALRDTLAFIAHSRESLQVYAVADPRAVRRLASVWVPGQARSVALGDSEVYLGCDDFRVFDVGDPLLPELRGRFSTPYHVGSIDAGSRYIYTACSFAGICILEQSETGICEPETGLPFLPGDGLRLVPNPVRHWSRLHGSVSGIRQSVRVFNVVGREVTNTRMHRSSGGGLLINFAGLPPGVYYVKSVEGGFAKLVRVVKI